jgi:hypothetical protein
MNNSQKRSDFLLNEGEAIAHKDLVEVSIAMRDYIDAIPKETELPTMPGFDRDWADSVIEISQQHAKE